MDRVRPRARYLGDAPARAGVSVALPRSVARNAPHLLLVRKVARFLHWRESRQVRAREPSKLPQRARAAPRSPYPAREKRSADQPRHRRARARRVELARHAPGAECLAAGLDRF